MANGKTLYSRIASIWTVIFIIVGTLFAIMPDKVGSFLTSLGNSIGLKGTIGASSDNLWFILALSLMSILTVNMWCSAKRPENKDTYISVLVAKSVSTIGFLIFAFTKAPIWVICAIGDGFVAITLWLSYKKSYKNG